MKIELKSQTIWSLNELKKSTGYQTYDEVILWCLLHYEAPESIEVD